MRNYLQKQLVKEALILIRKDPDFKNGVAYDGIKKCADCRRIFSLL